jgi:hypothetical protein
MGWRKMWHKRMSLASNQVLKLRRERRNEEMIFRDSKKTLCYPEEAVSQLINIRTKLFIQLFVRFDLVEC